MISLGCEKSLKKNSFKNRIKMRLIIRKIGVTTTEVELNEVPRMADIVKADMVISRQL